MKEEAVQKLTGPEDQLETELEIFKKLPQRYPEGKLAILDDTDGTKYTVIKIGKNWYKMTLAEV